MSLCQMQALQQVKDSCFADPVYRAIVKDICMGLCMHGVTTIYRSGASGCMWYIYTSPSVVNVSSAVCGCTCGACYIIYYTFTLYMTLCRYVCMCISISFKRLCM